jgi:EAL domain-containing protein (putative c-di-GMP-specific phosphodiesterase class I)
MRRYGFRFALDDFGSGHTSYRHLKNLRFDALKIDGSFIKDILDSPDDFAIVKSMNDIAHSLGMRTVAEYVESPAILAKLREIGVDYAQGFAIHKPCRIEQLLAHEAA